MTRRLALAIGALVLLLVLLIRASSGAMSNPFLDYENLGTWVGAALTLFALSFLYGDNPFYRITENIFVGVTAAYWMVTGFWRTIVPKLLANVVPEVPVHLFGMESPVDIGLSRRLAYCVPLVLGLLLLTRLGSRTRSLSVWTLAFIMGTTAGLRLIGYLEADFMDQIHNGIAPLIVLSEEGFQPGQTLETLILTGGTLCCLLYFFFSRGDTGAAGRAGRLGLWILMVTFGASFGFSVMGRIALLVGRMEFLLQDWLGVI